MLNYYRGRWPEENIPDGEPEWLHYEVDTIRDAVLRSVEMFTDGHSERNSIELKKRDGFPCLSIVDSDFLPLVEKAKLEPIRAEQFEELWIHSSDKPRR